MANAAPPIESLAMETGGRDYYKTLPTPNRSQEQPKSLNRFPELYPDEDVMANARKGWSWIAARQRQYANEDFHRGFFSSTNRCLLDLEQRMTCLELKLYELERDEDGETLCQLSFDPEEFLAQFCGPPDPPLLSSANGQQGRVELNISGTDSPGVFRLDEDKRKRMKDRENIIQALDAHLRRYLELLNASQAVQTKPRVSREQHYAIYKKIKRVLAKSASQYLWNRDDFVTLNPDVVHQRFEFLLYTTRPYLWEISDFFRRGISSFCRCFNLPTPARYRPGREDPPNYDYDARILRWVSNSLLAPTVTIFVLVPVGILFFCSLGKAGEFGVVLAFVALFASAISCFERSTIKIIVGVCTFEAVLAAFLAK